jgi:hypothetical protein
MLAVFDLLYLVVPLVVPTIAVFMGRARGRSAGGHYVIEEFLYWLLLIGVGVAGVLDGLNQMFNGHATAKLNDWPYSPFVIELGFAVFTFGVLGLLCIRIRGTWWYATCVGWAIYLLLAAIYHVYGFVAKGNASAGNVGLVLWSDIATGATLLILCVLHARSVAMARGAPIR